MCCLVTTLLLLGPRLAILAWWFLDSALIYLAFQNWPHPLNLAFPLWAWPLHQTSYTIRCKGRPNKAALLH